MSKDEKNEQPSRAAAPKKPYLKPAFLAERVFETMALSCLKMPNRGCAPSVNAS